MQTVLFKEIHNHHYYLLDIDSFFAKYLNKLVEFNAKYFELFTGNHMMIFSIEDNENKINYSFFDSNIGVFNFDNKEKFRLFLLSYLKNHEQIYNIAKNENGNYQLMIAAYKDTQDIKQQLIDLDIKQQDIAITATKIIFENQQKISRLFFANENLLYNVNIEFVNIDFSEQLVLVKLSYLHNNEKVIKNVIINELSVDKILNIIHEEYQELLNSDKITTFIEAENDIITYYDIETIPDRLSEIKHQKKSFYLIKKVDDFIFVENGNANDQNSHLTSGSRLLSDSVLTGQHTVIIQIQDDVTVADAVEKLKNKHPNSTTIIYFDMENNRYRVMYNSTELGKQGDVRWLIVAHGSYFNRLSPAGFAERLKKLKQEVFEHHEPKKIVFVGCKLAGENIIEDNALKLSLALWDYQFDATTSAYTKNIYISDSGHRVTKAGLLTSNFQHIALYKKTYQYHQLSNTIYINGQDYIFSILNDLGNNYDLVNSILAENEVYLKKYFSDNNGNLNIDLIRLVSYENEAYNIFKSYHHEVINNNLIFNSQDLLDRIIAKQINQIPVWRKVNADFIVENNSHLPIESKKNIIFRFSGDDKARQQAELIAMLDPNNTLIIQIDTKRKKYFIEYGKLAEFQLQSEQHWFLLGHVSPSGQNFSNLNSQSLSKTLMVLKEHFVLDKPLEVCMISTTKIGQNSSPYRTNWIASGIAKQLSAAGIDTVITFYTHRKGFLVNENLLNHNASFINCRYDPATKQILLNDIPITQSLLMSIALKEIPVQQAATKYYFYLQDYFANERKEIDINKLTQVVYDPIISKKVNNYFSQNQHVSANAMANWQLIFIRNTQLPLWQQAHELSSLLDAIYCDQSVLNHLSEQSNWILRQYFPLGGNEVNKGAILSLIANYPEYLHLQTSLGDLIGLSAESGIEGLSLRSALEKSDHWHRRIFINFAQLKQHISRNAEIDGQIRLFSHAFLLHDSNIFAANIEATLGIMYSTFPENASDNIHQLLNYHRRLHEQRLINLSSAEEHYFLQQFEQVFQYIKREETVGNITQLITTQSLEHWLPVAETGSYQLKAGNSVFTLLITQQTNGYQYALFDAKGGAIKLNGYNKRNVAAVIYRGLTDYLTVDLPKNFIVKNRTTRAAEIGIEKTAEGQFKFDIYRLEVTQEIKTKISSLIAQLPDKSEAIAQPLTVKTDATHIQLATLQQAGAQIDNQPVTAQSARLLANNGGKLTFDVQQLNDYLTFANGSQENSRLAKVINHQLNRVVSKNQLLANEQDLASSALLLERLSDIQHYPDKTLWPRLQQNSVKLPRFARMMNKIGYGTQAISLFQLINSTQAMLSAQQSSELNAQQRAEISKNIAITWGAAATNFSTDILQPLLLKSAYKVTGSYRVAGTFTGRAVIFLNAAAAGFDLYYAYENFSQLRTEKDADVRQDLIVNGVLSVLVAGIGLGTAFAIFAGSSLAGPIGIALGAGLMLGGMAYNGVRTVAKIKEKVKLTSGEEFETGLRAALGLNLTYSVQNKLQQYQVADSFKQALFAKQRNQFEDILKPSGYNLHFYIEEAQQAEELPYFHLIDKRTDEYIVYHELEYLTVQKYLTLFSNSIVTLWLNDKIDFEIEQNKRRFSEQEVRLILQQYPNRYNVESVKIKQYISASYSATDEIILLAEDLDNLLSNFPDINVDKNRIYISDSEQSKVLYFTPLNNQYNHNYNLIDNYLVNNYNEEKISAVSFNTGNGDDIIIGLSTRANRFEIYNGRKIFIGGNKNDAFVLNNRQFGINEIKYLYGKEGNDSIIINILPIQPDLGLIEPDFSIYNKHNNTSFFGSYIDLENGIVKYFTRPFRHFEYSYNVMNNFINSGNNVSQLVAYIDNFENASGSDKGHNIIIGNEKDNILSGGNGHAILYGGEGNDALLLTKGYASGGNGVDRYVIQRYDWTDHIKILPDYRFFNQWDPEQQTFINPNPQKQRFKFNRLFDYNSCVVIDETGSNDETIVELEYQLDEIKSFELIDRDIILKIEMDAPSELNRTAKSVIEIKLKNAYDYHGNGKHFLTHQYNLRTQDGFLLIPYLSQWSEPPSYKDVLFEIMYVRKFERHVTAARSYYIGIDLLANTLETYKKIYYLPNNIRPMKTGLEAVETDFSGDRFDNHFYNIKSNSYFYLTKGVDHYYINDMSIANLVSIYITFDYAKVSEFYTENDRLIIYLAEYSGYDFFFENNELVHKDKKNDIARIKFLNWQQLASINILIQDKNQQKFNIILSEQGNFIKPLDPIQVATEQDDIIMLPLDYRLNEKLLDAGDGNDIVTDISQRGHIIKGGKGNDIITVTAGNNILFDGEGNDALYGGDGDDILITTGGNVTLTAGKGNNIIFINQLNGHIKIINSGGKDTIILQDKKIADYQIVDHNGNRSYLSLDSLSGILIEDYEQQNITVKAGIGRNEPLNNEQMNGLIDFMAAFDNKSKNSSIDLITYLSTFNVEADFSVATTI